MKVYVCFHNLGHGVYGKPRRVFLDEEKAKEYTAGPVIPGDKYWLEYVVLEVNEG
ncbi:MAG: hypothetical protein ACWGQW_08380 [bacterium]